MYSNQYCGCTLIQMYYLALLVVFTLEFGPIHLLVKFPTVIAIPHEANERSVDPLQDHAASNNVGEVQSVRLLPHILRQGGSDRKRSSLWRSISDGWQSRVGNRDNPGQHDQLLVANEFS